MKSMKYFSMVVLGAAGLLFVGGGHRAEADVRVSVHLNSGYHRPYYTPVYHCAPTYYRHYPSHRYTYYEPRYYRAPRYTYGRVYHRYDCAPRRVVVCR